MPKTRGKKHFPQKRKQRIELSPSAPGEAKVEASPVRLVNPVQAPVSVSQYPQMKRELATVGVVSAIVFLLLFLLAEFLR